MAKQGPTGIVWTDETWNPVTGCTKVSQGCKHCYAERDWQRLQHLPRFAGRAFTDVVCHPERLDQPLRWSKPRRVFVNSMSDLFHDDVPDEFIDEVFAVMALATQHTFQVLTKRPERMRDYMLDPAMNNRFGMARARIFYAHSVCDCDVWMSGQQFRPLPNVWLGVSVEDQATADERIPILLQTPAAVRWISAEPLLGPIDLTSLMYYPCPNADDMTMDPGTGSYECCRQCEFTGIGNDIGIDWVVAGGESGPKARPSHPDWFRSLRDQCAEAGVAFLFKQWGGWIPYEHDAHSPFMHSQHGDFFDASRLPDFESGEWEMQREWHFDWASQLLARRVSKRAAGRLLDGVQHDEYPA